MAIYFRPSAAFFAINALITTSLMFCLLFTACDSGEKNASTELLESIRAEQQAARLVIGITNGDQLEYVDANFGYRFRDVSAPPPPAKATSLDLTSPNGALASSDGKWIASCDHSFNCTISEKGDPRTRFSVFRENILTPLFWSPDERFFFFVRKAPTWRLPFRCSMEDEYDITVYETAKGRHGVLATVCGGFPYGSLAWYELSPAR